MMSDEYWKIRDDNRKGRGRDTQKTVQFIPTPTVDIMNGPIMRRHSNVLPLQSSNSSIPDLPRKEYTEEITVNNWNTSSLVGVTGLSPKQDSVLSQVQRRRAKSLTPKPIGQHISKNSNSTLEKISTSPNTLSLFATSEKSNSFIRSISPLHSNPNSPSGPSLMVDSVLDEPYEQQELQKDDKKLSSNNTELGYRNEHEEFISSMGGMDGLEIEFPQQQPLSTNQSFKIPEFTIQPPPDQTNLTTDQSFRNHSAPPKFKLDPIQIIPPRQQTFAPIAQFHPDGSGSPILTPQSPKSPRSPRSPKSPKSPLLGGKNGGYIEHPMGEHPSRTLFVRNISSNVEDEELKQIFEAYGPIRSMYTQCKHRGFVMISYFDIRHAKNAMKFLQGKLIKKRKIDVHYSIPKDNPSEKDMNQGTLVVFNLDPSISNAELTKIFSKYGEVKEIRETPNKKHHKFIEFYDTRDADKAMKALNKMEIKGKKIKIEPSRPGGARRQLMYQWQGIESALTSIDTSTMSVPTFRTRSVSPTYGSHVVSNTIPIQRPMSLTPPQAHSDPGMYTHFLNPNSKMSPTLFTHFSVSPPKHTNKSNGIHSDENSKHNENEKEEPQQHGMHERMRSKNRVNSVEEKKKFYLDIAKVKDGSDKRTTLMIKNIPNKYTQRMLLQTIDIQFKGTYDFFYLPIDFKNRCNVGYAFINFINPNTIVEFANVFNRKKWEKFNSEKVCELTYARIQGKQNLIEHFQNSSLMCEDSSCRPIIFHSDGPNIGKEQPFPVGPNLKFMMMRKKQPGKKK